MQSSMIHWLLYTPHHLLHHTCSSQPLWNLWWCIGLNLKVCSGNARKCPGELGWRSGESARLPPMRPGFDSRTRRHMWVEFVVGSLPSPEGFSSGSLVFLPPQKSTFLNSNLIGNSRATGLSVEDCSVLPLLNKVNLFIQFMPMNDTKKKLVSHYKGSIPPQMWPFWEKNFFKMAR